MCCNVDTADRVSECCATCNWLFDCPQPSNALSSAVVTSTPGLLQHLLLSGKQSLRTGPAPPPLGIQALQLPAWIVPSAGAAD